MISGTSLFFGMFNNLAIVIVLTAVYGTLIKYYGKSSTLPRQIALGLGFGCFAIVCMVAKLPVAEGVIVDQRNTIIVLSGVFGGPVAGAVSAVMSGAYRLHLGGSGVAGGVIGVFLSALAGGFVHAQRDRIDNIVKALVAALASTIIILPGFLFIGDLQAGWTLLKAMALPYGSAVFTGIFLVGLLLARQEYSQTARRQLEQSEKRYRESEQRLDLALSASNVGIWDWDLAHHTVRFDARYYRLSGYAPNEFPGTFEEWEKRIHPEDAERAKSLVDQYLAGKIETYDAEFRFRHKDGHYTWIQSRGKIVARDEQGNPARFVGTHADISQRKQTEASLRLARFIFDKASIGIYQVGPDAKIYNANRQAAQSLGYALEELCQMSLYDIDIGLTRADWTAMWTTRLEGGWSQFERIHRRKDGSQMPVEITANLLQYEGNSFSVSFVQDITERKEAERRLKLSESRYQDLFDKAPIGYVVTDTDDSEPHIKDANEAFLRLLGYARQEVIDAPVSRFYTEASQKRLEERAYRHALNGGVLCEPRDLVTRDNRVIHTILHVHPQFDVDGNVIGMRAMYLDITDRKRAEDEARRLAGALAQAQKMETIGTLAGGIAHDFNNILGAILGYAQLVQINLQENAKVQRYIEQVFVACERAKELIQQILAFSRQSNMEKQPVDIGMIIRETLKLVRASIPATVEIQQDVRTNIGTVEANQTQLHQVILNLCTNAAHAMEPNGGRLVVELQPAHISESDCANFNDIKPGPYLKLSLTDTGIGMDSKTVSKIFEPYFTTKEVGEGTGMGLALVHGIVKDHGGDIKVYSEPGAGTTFHVLFPTIEGGAEEMQDTLAALPGGRGNVLFVDDEAPLVDIGKDLLEILGYTVETRTSPGDALNAVQANPQKYDLVITDMTMPHISGDQLARSIKQLRPDIPIIICTGFSKRISQEKAMTMGVACILMKPLTLADLAVAVSGVLDPENKRAAS